MVPTEEREREKRTKTTGRPQEDHDAPDAIKKTEMGTTLPRFPPPRPRPHPPDKFAMSGPRSNHHRPLATTKD